MKRWGITLAVLMAFTVNCVFAVDVNDVNSWKNAINGLNSGNVTINLTSDIPGGVDFNPDNWDKKTLENWSGRTLTINGNGHTLTIKSGFALSGSVITNINNVNIVTTDVVLYQKTNTTINSSTITITNNLTLNGGEGVVLNINSGSTLICNGKTDLGTKSTINVSGTFESSSFTSHDGSSTLKVLENGCASVKGDGIVTSGANFSVSQNGQLRFDGDFTLTNGSNMTLNGDMEVYGNMDVYYGNSTIDGTLRVAGNLSIYYDNDGGNENITGSGTIAANEFYCKDNNATSGESCVSQLSNHFNVNNIQRGNVVMPIVLSSFTASAQTNIVNVYWTTESEQNNDYFTIYRSADGEIFEEIGTVAGAGNSTYTINYSFTDYYPLDGISYYMLKQTDYNGEFKFSSKVFVKITDMESELQAIKVFPNPYKNEGLTIDLGTASNSNVQVSISTVAGKVVNSISCHTSSPIIKLTPRLSAGVYVVTVTIGGQSQMQKLVVE